LRRRSYLARTLQLRRRTPRCGRPPPRPEPHPLRFGAPDPVPRDHTASLTFARAGHSMNCRLPALFMIAIAANMVVAISSLATGPVHVPWHAVLGALGGRAASSTSSVIVLQLRLPRVLSAALVGAGLALAGAVLQSLLRNPLAEPFTLGVSGGAGFFVTALAAFAPAWFARPLAASAAGFAGALFSGGLVFLLAHRHGFTSTALILCGVILSFFFDSLVLVNFTVGRPEALQSAMTWLSGDF